MTARRIRIAAVLSSLSVLAPRPAVLAQRLNPSGQPSDTPVAGVSSPASVSIRINVVVTDKRGRSLLDLKPTDFQLDDNGVAQSLASVELRTPARPSAATAAPVTSIQTDDDERKAAQEAGARVFAVFLDEFNVTPGVNSERVRDAARRFLSDYVRPGDLIHVLKPIDPVSGFRFTRDRDAARAVIEKFEGRKGDYAARTPFETQYFGRTPEAVENARAQIVTTGLRELTMKIGRLESDKRRPGPHQRGLRKGARRRAKTPSRLAESGPRGKPLQSADLRARSARPSAGFGRPGGADGSGSRPRHACNRSPPQTGGEAVSDGRELLPALARMSRDLDGYYVLTYQPSQATDGRFHPIAVRTTRKDAQIRVPSGYWSPLSSEWRTWLERSSTPPGPSAPVRALRKSRLIDTWYGFERGDDGRLEFVFTWEPTRCRHGTSLAAARGGPESVDTSGRGALRARAPCGRIARTERR